MAQAAQTMPITGKTTTKTKPSPAPAAAPGTLPNREKAIQILSKSIYKELRENGYEPKQIVALATEIISLVTTDIGDRPLASFSGCFPGLLGPSEAFFRPPRPGAPRLLSATTRRPAPQKTTSPNMRKTTTPPHPAQSRPGTDRRR